MKIVVKFKYFTWPTEVTAFLNKLPKADLIALTSDPNDPTRPFLVFYYGEEDEARP